MDSQNSSFRFKLCYKILKYFHVQYKNAAKDYHIALMQVLQLELQVNANVRNGTYLTYLA